MVQRVKLTLEYDGGPYAGWQRQADQPSVQEELERAAEQLDGQAVTVQGAGRTDAGVHATGQVAHLDLGTPRPIHKVADALNFHLRPAPIAVLSAESVREDFSARFSAIKRVYRYKLVNRRADLALDRRRVWRVPSKLDAGLMHEAAQSFVGTHDFSTFRDTECQAASPVKSLDRIDVFRIGDRIEIEVEALSFLHRQARSMVGSLVEVGRGVRPVDWITEILDAKARERCGPVAPACGLYLEAVHYPGDSAAET